MGEDTRVPDAGEPEEWELAVRDAERLKNRAAEGPGRPGSLKWSQAVAEEAVAHLRAQTLIAQRQLELLRPLTTAQRFIPGGSGHLGGPVDQVPHVDAGQPWKYPAELRYRDTFPDGSYVEAHPRVGGDGFVQVQVMMRVGEAEPKSSALLVHPELPIALKGSD